MSWLQILVCLGLFFLIGSTSAGKEELFYSGHKGKYLGEFNLQGSPYLTDHDIAGEVYAINETALVVVGFAYNGAASDAYFFAHLSLQPGVIVPIDPFDEQLPLGKYDPHENGAFVILRLPNHITTYEKLSVGSDTSTAKFAEVFIPSDFDPPEPALINTFAASSVWADAVYILNNRQIYFEDLNYDGSCEEAYYWVGKGSVDSDGYKALDENLRTGKLPGNFSDQDVTVTLPRPLNISDIDYIGIWCKSTSRSLGRVTIPSENLNISPYIDEPYLGKYLGFFNFGGSVANNQHRVRGSVFANDDRTLVITDFTFDATAPSTFVWGSAGDIGDPDGDILPVDGSFSPLGPYEHDDIFVHLPPGKTLDDYGSISVYCRTAAANFALLVIPDNFEFPAPLSLGELGFSQPIHDVHADDVEIIDKHTFLIKGLRYDGNGPSTYFWVGTGDTPDRKGWKAFWELASEEEEEVEGFGEDDYYGDPRPVPYDGKGFDGNVDVYVWLPYWLTVFDIGHLGLWCIPFRQDFGHVDIPVTDESLCIPAYSEIDLDENGDYNCEVLKPQEFHVLWNVNEEEDEIDITMEGRIAPDEYLSFGLSGSETETNMIGSDVVVGYIEALYYSGGYVKDYYLTSREQCVISGQNGRGACPDERSSGTQDVELEYAGYYDGIATISYSRRLNTGDSIGDKIIPLDRAVYISWAIGRIDENGQIYKHRATTGGNHRIHFGRPGSVCPPLDPGPGADLPPWPQPVIFADSPNPSNPFRATIGQSGGRRGYDAITGRQGWGIVWYINDLLIPVITVKRGVTYTFEVYGGNDPSSPAAYHPFYITNDPIGGYDQTSRRKRQNIEIYAGPVVGPLCEWRSNADRPPDEFHTFFEYRDETLEEECLSGAPGILQWTPDANTPDTVYYQCYTHRYLGWKIKVVDEIPDCEADEFECEEVKHERCIDQAKVCDGYVDCGGPQDELNCPDCRDDQYECENIANHRCIYAWEVCDGYDDCAKGEDDRGEDERNCNTGDPCERQPCLNGGECFQATTTEYFCLCPIDYGGINCETYVGTGCADEEFQCEVPLNRPCIHETEVCDNNYDCGDDSDERDCECEDDFYGCQFPRRHLGPCIPLSFLCDGVSDCLDAEDEDIQLHNCVRQQCEDNEFTCNNGLCIPFFWVCDTDNDCGDSSDEGPFCETACGVHPSSLTLQNGGLPYALDYQPALDYPSGVVSCVWTITAPQGQRVYVQITSFTSEADDTAAVLTFGPSLQRHADVRYLPDSIMLDVVSPVSINALVVYFEASRPYGADSFVLHLSATGDTNIQTCTHYSELQVLEDNHLCDDFIHCIDGTDETELCPCPDGVPFVDCFVNPCEDITLCPAYGPEKRCEINHCGECSAMFFEFTGRRITEAECNNPNCAPGFFRCQQPDPDFFACLPPSYVCDGERDCLDAEDEDIQQHGCERRDCNDDEFTCDNGLCIPYGYVCDEYNDCGDTSDEEGCDNCDADQYDCQQEDFCIPLAWVCDGASDCIGADDEDPQLHGCVHRDCNDDEFTCDNGLCIPSGFVCDTDNDCGDASDEVDCDGCGADQYACQQEARCIPVAWVCDEESDCIGADDEDPQLHGCVQRECDEEDEITCDNGLCTIREWACDDYNDCGDNSDEGDFCENVCGELPSTLPLPDGGIPFILDYQPYPRDVFCFWTVIAPQGQRVYGHINSLTSEADTSAVLSFGRDDVVDYRPDSILLDVVSSVNDNSLLVQFEAFRPYASDSFVLQLSGTSQTDFQTCTDYSSLQVLQANQICDNFRHCIDGTDETELCPCPIGHVNCIQNPCEDISLCPAYGPEKVCDVNTCGECSAVFHEFTGRRITDAECNNPNCIPGFFRCQLPYPGFFTCLPLDYVCDGESDCLDAEDENGCERRPCNRDEFQCDNDLCVPLFTLCDMWSDCGDNSDEEYFCDGPCGEGEYTCPETGPGYEDPCIRISRICNGASDCYNAQDEDPQLFNCERTDCFDDEFTCENGLCISRNSVCDNYNDCGDNSDEGDFCATACGEVAEFVTLPDGGFPFTLDYQPALDQPSDIVSCTWTFTAPQGQRVYVQIVTFTSEADDTAAVLTFGQDSVISYHPNSLLLDVVSPVNDNTLDVSFEAHRPYATDSFVLQVSGTSATDIQTCTSYSLLQVLEVSQLCDDFRHCIDGTDETELCPCPDGVPAVDCEENPCLDVISLCPAYGPEKVCEVNNCGECSAVFYNLTGRRYTEAECNNPNCAPGFFRCEQPDPDYFACLPPSYVCDGERDCLDAEDEDIQQHGCDRRSCSDGEFQCDNELCIDRSYVCDMWDDCGDNSDEDPESCTDDETCDPEYYTCQQIGQDFENPCISYDLICNGVIDCYNAEDEDPQLHNCDHRDCEDGEFRCDIGVCVPEYYRCDGTNDCGDYSDETDCECEENEFLCEQPRPGNPPCTSPDSICDGIADCLDAADEDIGLHGCRRGECDDDEQFTCNNGLCITTFWLCDGDNDCGDNSDEGTLCQEICGQYPSHSSVDLPSDGSSLTLAYQVPSTYPGSQSNCVWTFFPPTGYRVYVRVIDFTTSSDDLGALLQIGPNESLLDFVIYQSDSVTLDVISFAGYDSLAVSFEANRPFGDDSLVLEFSATDGADIQTCASFPSMQVLQADQICDGFRHCLDGTDETELCSCPDGVPHVGCFLDPCEDVSLCPAYGRDKICEVNYCGECSAVFYESTGRRISDAECNGPCAGDLYRCQQPRPDGYTCILPSSICDGVADCLDAQDEDTQIHNCPDPYECNDGFEFTCDNQLCVLNSFLCDGQNDCGDNSDEGAAACSAELPAVIATASLLLDEEFLPEYRDLTSPEFQQAASDFEEAIFTYLAAFLGDALAEIQVSSFSQGSLIPYFTVVFNYPPGDLSTAQQDIENILLSAFRSLTNSGTLGSFSVLPDPVPPISVEVECEFGYFSCHNELCIPYNNVCDANDDCGDASDEVNCDICPSGVPLTTCPAGPCSIAACTGSASCSDEFCASCNTLYFDARGSPLPGCNDCPIEACTLEWNPQCGSDGVTYGNPCLLAAAACRNPGLTLAYPGECIANPCANQPCQNGGTCIDVAADYICQCRSGFTGPLCEILPDICPLRAPLVSCFASPCSVSPACPGSYRCDDVYCGGCTAIFFDSFGNPLPDCYEDDTICAGDCPAKVFWSADIDRSGYRYIDSRFLPQCPVLACTREWNPQCGSDGVTYGNPCELAAAACRDPTLTLAYLGECIGTPCSIQPCLNGGSCIDVPTGYVCSCPAEYTGTYCQIPVITIDPCESQPCQNGGTCLETTVGYICRCRTGFTGPTCEILPDICPLAAPLVACFDNPCFVSPACPGSDRCDEVYCGGCTAIFFDSFGNPLPDCYECPVAACTLEWNPQCGSDEVTYGNPCALAAAACSDPTLTLAYLGECIENACNSNPCLNGGVCGRQTNGYFCQCRPDFTGSRCELPITEVPCSSNPCLNGGTCESFTGFQGYFCRCPSAFVGTRCETMISVNVCNSQPCLNGGSCEESAGGYRCRCLAGYAGPVCEILLPVNPCDSRPCQNGGTCTQMSSTTYVCRCNVGYTGIACEMTTSGCQIICETDEYDPHCGSDGTTYTSLCELERAKTCLYPELRLLYPGECRAGGCPPGVPTAACIADPCEINQCPSYPNARCLASYCGGCFAHFFEENGNPISECSGCPIEFCTLEWDPQCGSNGVTYDNPCKLSAAACFDRYLTLDSPGECQSGCPFDTCTAEYNPVCGTNGVSYTNPCWLDVASCRDSSITLRHEGPCRPFPPGCPIDFCTEEYNPRCGLDGQTYSNPCYFAQEVCHNPGLRLAYEGECQAGCPITDCPDEYDPQCGTNGQTYSNLCELNAAACFTPFLQRAHEGQCGPAPRPWPVASVGYDGNIKFIVEIGDSGGLRGYTGITGYPSPGIAWYINGQLIPVITVQRGSYYIFQVSGGRDHGFYITNDSMGGYRIQTSEERQNVIIYAGPVDGPLCEWKAVSGMSPDSFGSFAAFSQAGLSRTCEEGEPGLLVWRPDENTPDVLYYQSYNERYVGWKIRVVNQLPRSSSNVIASTKITLLLMVAVALAITYL